MRLSALHSPALALALALLVFADGEKSDVPSDVPSDVVKLTAANFDDSVKNTSLMLVEFFAPWYATAYMFLLITHHTSLGVDTAKPSHLITKKLQPHSKPRTSHLLLLTASTKLTYASQRRFRATRQSHIH